MTDTPPNGDLTPPGPPTAPAGQGESPRPPARPAYGAPSGAYPPPSDSRGGDTALGWTAFGLALPLCVPCLPLAGLVLAVITLVRRRFRPRWIAVVALLAGLVGTGLQVWLVTDDEFWEDFRDGMNESIEDDTEDARRSGEPTEVSPLKLEPGDCINDEAIKGASDDPVMTQTVTLLPCKDKHDLEVYASITVPGNEYPGQDAVDEAALGCFPQFRRFVGKPYAESALEVYYLFPTKRSWNLLDDRSITCLVGHPGRRVGGTLEDSRR